VGLLKTHQVLRIVVVQTLDQRLQLFVQMAQLFYLLAVVEVHLHLVVVCKVHYVRKAQVVAEQIQHQAQ
jgi:hypothetical protein